MIINNNVTDFNQIEWNGLPYGDPANRNIEKHIAIIEFDNGSKVHIGEFSPVQQSGIKLYNLWSTTPNVDNATYVVLAENEITIKLLEISKL